MVFSRFRILIILRVVILTVIMAAVSFLTLNGNYIAAGAVFLLFLYFIISLIRFVEKSNRDLQRFLDSIRHSDFSISFVDKNLGPSFSGLREAFSSIISDFRQQRKETEEQQQYLQTVLKHIGVGFISFDREGKIELINLAAERLFGNSSLLKIRQLNSLNPEFENILMEMKSDANYALETENNGVIRQLSLNATEFLIKGKKNKLVAFQDITGELERERMANELEIARNIQMKLIPQEFPQIPGYEICGICSPAKEVGGDYYDFSQPGENRLGIVIGDVSGKGVPASIYMTLTKGIFQSYAVNNESPGGVLASINNSLHRLMEKGTFVTMIYGILDYEKDELKFCRAGHNPLLHFDSASGLLSNLKPSGAALGFSSKSVFDGLLTEEKIKMNAGDYVLFFTDGLTEAKNQSGEFFGEERLFKVFTENTGKSPAELIEAIADEMNVFRNETEQYDDVTIVALRKLQDPGR